MILGTGWGSYSLLRHVDKKRFDVVVISPRNHFLFTPLMASTTVGTLEFRSIIEPIRNAALRDEHHYHQSQATSLDTKQRVVECVSVLDRSKRYSVPYDTLVIGVGASPNHFNIPGVQEHAFFLKVCTKGVQERGRERERGGGEKEEEGERRKREEEPGEGGEEREMCCHLDVCINCRKFPMLAESGTRYWGTWNWPHSPTSVRRNARGCSILWWWEEAQLGWSLGQSSMTSSIRCPVLPVNGVHHT